MLKLALRLGLCGGGNTYIVNPAWILFSGSWDDDGIWLDDQRWSDG